MSAGASAAAPPAARDVRLDHDLDEAGCEVGFMRRLVGAFERSKQVVRIG